jgi:hypothetical protein
MSVMIGFPLLLALAASTQPIAPKALSSPAEFRPTGGATVRATVSIRVLSGVRFGPGTSAEVPGALRRTARSEHHERLELLEFQ